MTILLRSQRGFTVTELILAMGIMLILLGFGTVNLLGSREKASITATVQTLIADAKQQQIKSMVRDTEGRSFNSVYGIYFESNRYTIFHDVYSSSNPENFVINLDNSIQISNVSFPGSQVIFAAGSGEIVGFVNGSNTITIRNTTNNEQKTIQLNRYGVVTNIN